MSIAIWPIKILFHGVFVILSWKFFNSPWVYICMLAVLALLSILNTEGAHRRLSWQFLIIQYGILLIFAVSRYADRHGGIYKGIYFWWWILPILIAFIANMGVSAFLAWLKTKKNKATDKAKNISKKVVRKLDSLAEPNMEKSNEVKPGYKKVRLSDIN